MERIEYEMPGCLGGKVYLGSYEDQYRKNFSEKYENTFNVWCFYHNVDDEVPFYEVDMGTPRWNAPATAEVVAQLVKNLYGYTITDTKPYSNPFMALWSRVEPTGHRYGDALEAFYLEVLFSTSDPVWKIMYNGAGTGYTIPDRYRDRERYERSCFTFLYGAERAAEIMNHLDEPEKNFLFPSFIDGELCYDLELHGEILAHISKDQLGARYEYIETRTYESGTITPTHIEFHVFRLDEQIMFVKEEEDYFGDIFTTTKIFSSIEECREYMDEEERDL